jgi:hypothetical protein
MKSNTLETIEDQLSQVFDRRREPQTWPDGFIVLRGDIDDPLNDALGADLSELNSDSLVGSAPDTGGNGA